MKNIYHLFAALTFLIFTSGIVYSGNSQTEFDIICSDISSNGIGSSYIQHTFSLDCGTAHVSDYKWTFKLKQSSGEYAVVSTGNGSSFTIDEITDYSNYFVNNNGALEGRIECSYTFDGYAQVANTFALSLELKPVILSIEKQRIDNKDNYSYYLLLDIRYAGADYVTVEIEEEYNGAIQCERFYGPFLVHAKVGNITSLSDSWVTIIVKNQYGTASETFYYKTIYDAGVQDVKITSPGHQKIEVYSVDGSLIYSGFKDDFKSDYLSSGLYIKKLYDESSRCVKASKFYVK